MSSAFSPLNQTISRFFSKISGQMVQLSGSTDHVPQLWPQFRPQLQPRQDLQWYLPMISAWGVLFKLFNDIEDVEANVTVEAHQNRWSSSKLLKQTSLLKLVKTVEANVTIEDLDLPSPLTTWQPKVSFFSKYKKIVKLHLSSLWLKRFHDFFSKISGQMVHLSEVIGSRAPTPEANPLLCHSDVIEPTVHHLS